MMAKPTVLARMVDSLQAIAPHCHRIAPRYFTERTRTPGQGAKKKTQQKHGTVQEWAERGEETQANNNNNNKVVSMQVPATKPNQATTVDKPPPIIMNQRTPEAYV